MTTFTTPELEAYLDEALPAEMMATLEREMRAQPALAARLATLNAQRDAGLHTLGAIWRRWRLTCPGRQELSNYLLDVLPPAAARYVTFHVQEIGCRLCKANLDDLAHRQRESAAEATTRRRRYFQSSAGRLTRK
jgi:anti-sigma factor RsiW